ncbi:MAG: hypothetical protein NWE93_12490 [Candidatus Bathyarchaeota archaeon]|nr:hypothetical protein [Candidatus Bathyarchaeota archaeon]
MKPNLLTFDDVIVSQGAKKAKTPRVGKVEFKSIRVKGKTLKFTEAIVADVSSEGKVYSCTNRDFGIVVMSPNLQDCIRSFEDEIRFIYSEYALESDEKLTADARDLKSKILSRVKS